MPRKRKTQNNSHAPTFRYWKYCDDHQHARGFTRHERYCKMNFNRQRTLRNRGRRTSSNPDVNPHPPGSVIFFFFSFSQAYSKTWGLQGFGDMDIDPSSFQEDPDLGPREVVLSPSPVSDGLLLNLIILES